MINEAHCCSHKHMELVYFNVVDLEPVLFYRPAHSMIRSNIFCDWYSTNASKLQGSIVSYTMDLSVSSVVCQEASQQRPCHLNPAHQM